MSDREIYRECFGQDPQFEDALFKIKPYTLSDENGTVSLMFLLDCEITQNGKHYPAKYIFAACTKKSERKKGYMETLLKRVINNNNILVLRPANENLINYYKKFGFKEYTATDKENENLFISPKDNFEDLAQLEGTTCEGQFTLMTLNSPIDLNGVSFPFTMP